MKKVFITGANKGIGFATAKLLLQKGYYVYLGSRNFHNGISAIQELKADGLKNVECVQIDVTKDSSVKSARELLSKKTDVLDVLINNAGINGGNEPYTALTAKPDEFQAAFEVNVIGVSPRIVNLSTSVGSLTLQSDANWPAYDHAKYAVYAASKAALNMYTVHLAYELQHTNFKVNAVCPGLTATDFTFGNGGDVEIAARRVVRYATLDKSGPTGKFFSEETNPETLMIPW